MSETEEREMNVLVASDGSKCAEVALDLVRSITWPAGSVIHLVTVVEPTENLLAGAFAPAVAQDMDEQLADVVASAEVVLGHAARSLGQSGAQIETAVLQGRAGSAIVEKAKAINAQLIVIGSRGHGSIGSMVLGSVSAEVADHAPCPVLVARNRHLTHVVLGADGSSYARAAEDVLADWPIFRHTAIEVISVAFVGLPWTSGLALNAYAPPGEDYPESGAEVIAEYQRAAEGATERLAEAGLSATSRVLRGDAAGELLRIAQETGADLIVVGTHGRTGLRRLLAGSVARNVMLHAGCSVLVVREPRPLT